VGDVSDFTAPAAVTGRIRGNPYIGVWKPRIYRNRRSGYFQLYSSAVH
jgi:hypothetical protein